MVGKGGSIGMLRVLLIPFFVFHQSALRIAEDFSWNVISHPHHAPEENTFSVKPKSEKDGFDDN